MTNFINQQMAQHPTKQITVVVISASSKQKFIIKNEATFVVQSLPTNSPVLFKITFNVVLHVLFVYLKKHESIR